MGVFLGLFYYPKGISAQCQIFFFCKTFYRLGLNSSLCLKAVRETVTCCQFNHKTTKSLVFHAAMDSFMQTQRRPREIFLFCHITEQHISKNDSNLVKHFFMPATDESIN